MHPKPNPADFTHNGELQQPHYDNAVRAWEKLERMEGEKVDEKKHICEEHEVMKQGDGYVYGYCSICLKELY